MKTFSICDGFDETCNKDYCYLNGGECHHTSNSKNAKYQNVKDRIFVKTAYGDRWELEPVNEG